MSIRLGCMDCGAAWHGATLHSVSLTCPECGAGETFVERQADVDLVDIQANQEVQAVSVAFPDARITASAEGRSLGGTLVVYGQYGRTSRGRLKVRPGALRFHEDLTRTVLTEEHNREKSRGVLASVHDTPERMRVQLRPADGPDGDKAIQEAKDGSRAALSFDVIDATVDGDEITDALVIAIGQVGIPAYDDARIDSIAASINPGEPMTEQERARLAELAAKNQRSTEEEQEYQALTTKAVTEVTTTKPAEEPATPEQQPAGGETVAANNKGGGIQASSIPAVPGGVPTPVVQVKAPEGQAFAKFVSDFTKGLREYGGGGGLQTITAALQDITWSAHQGVIEPPAWSGELWSGLQYESEWADLFTTAPLTHWEGTGWRFTSKLEMQDYAGDKAEIPSDNVTTEPSAWEAARMAVGVDIDRKFFDFPSEGFVASLFEQVRESWAIKLDAKIRAYVLAKAQTAETIGTQSDLLKAAALAIRALKRRRVGQATFVYVNDDDLMDLFDRTNFDLPAYLDLWKVDPKDFRSSPDVTRGTVLAGVRQAATVRTLPGSPIRVEAQNLNRAGVDEAFFGYWAIEEHHTKGIAKVAYDPDFVPAP